MTSLSVARLPAPLDRNVSETKVWGPTFEEWFHTFGWFAPHFRPGMRAGGRWVTAVSADGEGWPDYAPLVHPESGDWMAVELKVRYDKPDEKQLLWLARLEAIGWETHVWYPHQLPEIVARLAAPRSRLA